MRTYVIGLFVLAGCWMPGFQSRAEAQVQRDRFVVVSAEELAGNPQRYWSRGIVFEDVLSDVTGRGKRAGGRRFVQIRTDSLGQSYVDESIIGQVRGLTEGRKYLFAGTVQSESSRSFPLFRPRTRYFVTIDAVEILADDVKGDLLDVFIGKEPDRRAFQNVQRAIARAQQQLIAFAQNEGVDVETLFDPAAETMDKAAEVSRVAVRAAEQELGISSMEILSLLVRELLAAQYIEREIEPAEPEAVAAELMEPDEEEEVEAADAPPVPATEESIEEDEQGERESSRRRIFRRSPDLNQEPLADVGEENASPEEGE